LKEIHEKSLGGKKFSRGKRTNRVDDAARRKAYRYEVTSKESMSNELKGGGQGNRADLGKRNLDGRRETKLTSREAAFNLKRISSTD